MFMSLKFKQEAQVVASICTGTGAVKHSGMIKNQL